MYTPVPEDSSTASTLNAAGRVEFGKKSTFPSRGQLLLTITVVALISCAHALPTVPTVVVEANNKTTYISTGSGIIITAQQIAQSGAHFLTEIVENTGAIRLISSSGHAEQAALSIRGFGENAFANSVILLNGYPLTNPDMAPPDLNMIAIDSIDYIEIFPNSSSVLVGDGAVGGVINIVTKTPHQPLREIGIDRGSYGQAAYHLAVANVLVK